MNSDSAWKPTLTLAKLFEAQNQFYDALAIYEVLYQTDQTPELKERIDALQKRVLDDPNMRYDPKIEKLFSPEELVYLKIMNHSAFGNLHRMQNQFTVGTSDYETLIKEDEPNPQPQEESMELENMLGEIDEQAEQQAEQEKQEQEELTVEDLAKEMDNRFGKDNRVKDISVQEFMQVLKKYNLLSGLNKKP